jgi:ABC-type sugar transport system ATPase subunit
MIELCDVSIQLGSFELDNISFQVQTGEYAILMGSTGSGKTTILEAICGLRRIDSGKIMIHSSDVTDWPPRDRQIGYVPQDLALFPTMTVLEHLEFAQRLRKCSAKVMQDRCRELSELLGIAQLLDRKIAGLSGGESQRVALGRALSFQPSMLLLDEPLSALDESTRIEMQTLLRDIKTSTGVTTLHVTHNSAEAESLADRRLELSNGAVHS